MTAFEFVFVIYALILGLSMVELLAGFGRTLEYKFVRNAQHKAFSIGWLTPLLGFLYCSTSSASGCLHGGCAI